MTSTAGRTEVRKHYRGCYRLTLDGDRFAQIKRVDRNWTAEIRNTETGDLIRPAGLWATRREAVKEARSIAS